MVLDPPYHQGRLVTWVTTAPQANSATRSSRRDPVGGDQRVLVGALYVVLVLVAGAFLTWLLVPLPRGSGARSTRTPWSAALGLFASIPIAYLVLVVAIQVLKPIFV